MALSSEFKIQCKECHLGKKGLTRLGAYSYAMWQYSIQNDKECTECHQVEQAPSPSSVFKRLTDRGQQSKNQVNQVIFDLMKTLQFSEKLIQEFRTKR